MQVKMFEVLDRATLIPVVAVLMEPSSSCGCVCSEHGVGCVKCDCFQHPVGSSSEAWLLRRSGFNDHNGLVTMFKASSRSVDSVTYDPYDWTNRTLKTAHHYIQHNWDKLRTGQVIDVQYVLGEYPTPRRSERGL